MRISNSIALATALAASLSNAAFAAPFDGPYVGAQVGWQSEKMRDVKSSLGIVPVNEKKDSVTGGVFAGYDKTINGRFVVGVEGGIDFGSDAQVTAQGAANSYSVEPKYSLDLTARAGYLVNPKTLIYARGGYTNAHVRTTVSNASGIQTASDNQDGWLAGAGVERQIAQNVSARIEYRYSKLSEGNGKDYRHRVLAGLSYRF